MTAPAPDHMTPDKERRMVNAVGMVGRAGASSLEFGWTCPHTPDVGDSHGCAGVTFHAQAAWRGARLSVDGHATPWDAVIALGERVQRGAACAHCSRRIAWGGRGAARPMVCQWVQVDGRWEPGCTGVAP